MDGGVELAQPQTGSLFCDSQHAHTTVLHDRQTAADEPAIHVVCYDTYRLC